MLIDSQEINSNKQAYADICIIGSGPAGMTIANELIENKKIKVILVESGGVNEVTYSSQSIFEGKITGKLEQDLTKSRCRKFGGTANFWVDNLDNASYTAVRSVPLSNIDFKERLWIPNSGWPFSYSSIANYYKRAENLLELESFDTNYQPWNDLSSKELPIREKHFKTEYYQFGYSSTFLDDIKNKLINSSSVEILTNCHLIDVVMGKTQGIVEQLEFLTLQGSKIFIKAKNYILSAGGIENARILLSFNNTYNNKLGNQSGLVGKYFMEHPIISLGEFFPFKKSLIDSATAYDLCYRDKVLSMGRLDLNENAQINHHLLNTTLLLIPRTKDYNARSIRSLKRLIRLIKGQNGQNKSAFSTQDVKNLMLGIDDVCNGIINKLRHGKHNQLRYKVDRGGWSLLPKPSRYFTKFEVVAVCEQPPNSEIQIELKDDLDEWGMKKIKDIEWNFDKLLLTSLAKVEKLFAEEVSEAGLGSYSSWIDKNDDGTLNLDRCYGGNHHMGTTRMHNNPSKGVVDVNCQVHGVRNLYVSGSSVFPTVGFANPTFTIIALSLRLSDYLKQKMTAYNS